MEYIVSNDDLFIIIMKAMKGEHFYIVEALQMQTNLFFKKVMKNLCKLCRREEKMIQKTKV